VYVSFGTILGHMSFAEPAYRTVIHAVAGLDARVLVTTGRAFAPSRLRGVPGNVHVEAWVDQADVLGEASLVVCHGGSGTTYGALAAGVPLVVVPLFVDQLDNAPKVVQAGAGIQVVTGSGSGGRRHPATPQDARRIRGAIEAVLGDGAYQEAARAVAAEMAAAPAIGTLLVALSAGGVS
jgi:MGT family glycosyltransferase